MTNVDVTATGEDAVAERLRGELAEAIARNRADVGKHVDERILAAVRAVPRHLFVPGVGLETAYADDSPIMKRDAAGVAISSVSAPWLQAMILQQARIEPGMRVLEIGSGGYNAALIAELVGPDGVVVTLDIDRDVCRRAEQGLAAAGYDDVTVVCADGEFGAKQYAPFDRIIVTVSAPDIPPAWIAQLTDDGRLVVPLRMRGLTRSFTFEREGGHLACREFELCGFVPMQGAGESRQRLVDLGDGIVLKVDDRQPVEAVPLRRALAEPGREAWSGVVVGGMEPWDDLDLWLATVSHSYGYLTATDAGFESGVVRLAKRWGMSAVWDCDSLAYLAWRPAGPDRQSREFGAIAHGPHATALADRMVGHIRAWDRDQRHDGGPRFEVHPKTTLDGDLPPAIVIDKPHSYAVVSWPSTPNRDGQAEPENRVVKE